MIITKKSIGKIAIGADGRLVNKLVYSFSYEGEEYSTRIVDVPNAEELFALPAIRNSLERLGIYEEIFIK